MENLPKASVAQQFKCQGIFTAANIPVSPQRIDLVEEPEAV